MLGRIQWRAGEMGGVTMLMNCGLWWDHEDVSTSARQLVHSLIHVVERLKFCIEKCEVRQDLST
jgi:hypothetical protein